MRGFGTVVTRRSLSSSAGVNMRAKKTTMTLELESAMKRAKEAKMRVEEERKRKECLPSQGGEEIK